MQSLRGITELGDKTAEPPGTQSTVLPNPPAPQPETGAGWGEHKERVHTKTPASTLQICALAPGILALVQWAAGYASEGQRDPRRREQTVCRSVGGVSGSPRDRDTDEEIQREQRAQAGARCQGGTYTKGLRKENEIEPPVSLPAPCWL